MGITYQWLKNYKNNHFKGSNFDIRNRDSRVGGYHLFRKIGKHGAIKTIIDCKNAGECLSAMEALLAVKSGEIKL